MGPNGLTALLLFESKGRSARLDQHLRIMMRITDGKQITEVKKMPQGTVKRWFAYRGYGFITPEGESDDVFVHVSDVEQVTSLREGEKVEFEVESTYKGPRAINVKPVSE